MKKKKINLTLFIVLLITISLIGCKKENNTSENQKIALGRYVETEQNFPEPLTTVCGFHKNNDGVLELLGVTKDYSLQYLTSKDKGKTWTQKQYPFLDELKNSDVINIIAIAWDENDTIYFCYDKMDETNSKEAINETQCLAYVDEANSLKELPFSIPSSQSGAGPVSFLITKNGDFLFNCYFSILQIDGKTGDLIHEYSPLAPDNDCEIGDYDVFNNTLALSGKTKVFIYDLDTGELIQSFSPEIKTSEESSQISYSNDYKYSILLKYDNSGSLYIINEGGMYHCVNNNSMFEKLIEGTLTSLSIPSINKQKLLIADNSYLVLSYSNESYSLFLYKYDPTVPTLPSEELTIYSLEDDLTVRQAIGMFCRSNPSVYISYEVGLDEEGANRDDELKRLASSLIAGDGPDILILDSLPLASYEKKSLLLNLSDFIDSQLKNDKLISSVSLAYQKEDKSVYAVPARFEVPMMLGDKDAMDDIKSLSDLTKWAKENQENYEYSLNTQNYEALIKLLYPVCASTFYTKEGGLSESDIKTFLMDIKEICDLNPQKSVDPSFDFDALPWMKKETGISIGNVNFFEATYAPYTALLERTDGNLAPLLNQNIFIPKTLLSINSQSDNIDLALSFLDFTLSESVLSYNFRTGMPVSKAAFAKNLEVPESKKYYAFYGVNGISLQISYPPEDFRKELSNRFQSINKKTDADATILSILLEESENYFNGSFPINHTVSIISDKINTYLEEQK